MPCYTVQTCSVELNNADHDLLEKSLAKLGWKVTRNGKSITFSKNGITGTYVNNKLKFTGQGSQELNTDEIKRGYSKEVVLKKVKEYTARGWHVKSEKGEYVFSKPTTVGVNNV